MKKLPLKAVTRRVAEITDVQRREMYDLFVQYYNNVTFEDFVSDLEEKDGAILGFERKEVVGFTTYVVKKFDFEGKKANVVFSGDTVLAKRHWGNRKGIAAFMVLLLRIKLKTPGTPLYWFLISKGYKTYLLMTNNFLRYEPRHDTAPDPMMTALIRQYCDRVYDKEYNRKTGLLEFGEGYQNLKGHVAEITAEMKRDNPKIAYFEEMNPTWRNGTELPCIGEVSVGMLTAFLKKLGGQIVSGSWQRKSEGPRAQKPRVVRDGGNAHQPDGRPGTAPSTTR